MEAAIQDRESLRFASKAADPADQEIQADLEKDIRAARALDMDLW